MSPTSNFTVFCRIDVSIAGDDDSVHAEIMVYMHGLDDPIRYEMNAQRDSPEELSALYDDFGHWLKLESRALEQVVFEETVMGLQPA
jgi:hypothetical protein